MHLHTFKALIQESRFHHLNNSRLSQSEPIKQTTIYVGLNDSETGIQKYDTEKYVSILKNICRNYKVPFTLQKIEGGYFYDNGHYTEEATLALLLVDIPDDKSIEIAKDLCVFFNQESVMLVSSPCSVVFVNENLQRELKL